MSDIELTPSANPNIARPIGSPIAMSDPNARSKMTTAAISPKTSPDPEPSDSNEKKRSPPNSMRSGESCRSSSAAPFRLSRSFTLSSSSNAYCTRTTATRPSGEIDPLAAAVAGPDAKAPVGSLVPSTFGNLVSAACTSASAIMAAAESKNVAPLARGVTTT